MRDCSHRLRCIPGDEGEPGLGVPLGGLGLGVPVGGLGLGVPLGGLGLGVPVGGLSLQSQQALCSF